MSIKCRANEALISVIDLEMAVSIPVFPPWCVVPPVDKICSFYGIRIPCVPAINFEDIFGLEVEMGHWITFILLVLVGTLNLTYVQFPQGFHEDYNRIVLHHHRVFRVTFHISRFLLIGAALHAQPCGMVHSNPGLKLLHDQHQNQRCAPQSHLFHTHHRHPGCHDAVLIPSCPR